MTRVDAGPRAAVPTATSSPQVSAEHARRPEAPAPLRRAPARSRPDAPVPSCPGAPAPHAGFSTAAGVIAGLTGRLFTNNLTQTAANYQSGVPRVDLSFGTARALLVGSGVQTGVTYGVRRALDGPAEATFGRGGRTATDVFAGAVGGVAMHPASVRFFLADTVAPAVAGSRFPALEGARVLLRRDPKIFLRGLGARLALSGLDWGLYFGTREPLRRALPDSRRGLADSGAALGAIVATTPIYRVYVQQIKTGQGAWEAARSLYGSGAGRGGSLALTSVFVGIAVLEKVVVDQTKVAVESRAASRGACVGPSEAEPYSNVQLR